MKLLVQAGVWEELPRSRTCRYTSLQTWEDDSAKLTFDCQNIGVDSLGYFVENKWVQAVLWQALLQCENVALYEKCLIDNIKNKPDSVSVTLGDGKQLSADLLIACDGANLFVRQHLSMGVTAWDYRQSCMLVNIIADCKQQATTEQEFRTSGPCVFLPMAGFLAELGEEVPTNRSHASLVWYHNPLKIK